MTTQHKHAMHVADKQLPRFRSLHRFHWLVLLSSLVVTLVAWHFTQTQAQVNLQSRFDREVAQTVELIQERMLKYEDALWAGVAAIHAKNGEITPQRWKDFADHLNIEQKYPGINGIGYIEFIEPQLLDEFITAQRQHQPTFTIYPKHTQDEFWPITSVEPLEFNFKAVGLDIAHEHNRLTAARQARDTGTAQITGPIILVQDAEKMPGFLLYAPYYNNTELANTLESRRSHFVRLVYAPFIVERLMKGTLQKEKRHIGIQIRDEDIVLYDEHRDSIPDYDPTPLLTTTKSLLLYGRTWDFDIRSTLDFRTASSTHEPTMILLGGLTIDALLLIIFLLMAKSNKKARTDADKMTSDIQDRNIALENAVEGICKLDTQGYYLYANEAYAELFGHNPQELIGTHWHNSLHPEEKELISAQYHLMKTKGKTCPETRGMRKDGSVFHIQFTMVANEDQEGLFTGHYCFVTDISDRVRTTDELHQSIQFQNLILTTIPDLIFVKDQNFRIVKANTAFLNLYPEPIRQTVLGSTTFEAYSPEQANEFLHFDRIALLEGHSETYETVVFPNNDVRTLFTTKVRFYDTHDTPFILGIARDVTEREALVRQLTTSNEELDEFAYIASHDLKEPLRGIHTHASMLKRNNQELLNEDGSRRLNRIVHLTKYMETLVSDLLYFSRMGRTDIAKQPVNLSILTQEIVDSIPLVEEQEVKITILPSLPTIVCDRVRMGEVYRNLVTNGIKYNDQQQKHIEIGCELSKVDGIEQLVYFVRDNGIGIEAIFFEEIFRIFKRLHKKETYGGGTGAGLTFVSKIIERHNGKVWLTSEKGRGSTFYFTLPQSTN